MVSTDAKSALLLVLGVGLLLNPLYLFPGDVYGTGSAVTYDVERIPNETVAERALIDAEMTLRCGTERPCLLEREIADAGRLEATESVQRDDRATDDPFEHAWARYSLVHIDGEFYVPAVHHENETTILSNRPVSTMEALEHVAVSSDRTSSRVREAVETGSITVYGRRIPEFERGDPIRHEGEFYRVTGVHYSTASNVRIWRLLAFLGGFTLVGFAWALASRNTLATREA